jgi:AraC-like DNA-binding protein
VIYSHPSKRVCTQIAVISKISTPEVVLVATDDSILRLRSVIARNTSSVPALVLQAICAPLAILGDPLGPMVTAYFAWAEVPHEARELCELTGLSRKRILAGLDHQGLGTTRVILEVARVANAFHFLADRTALSTASGDAGFGTEAAMRGAFQRALGVSPHLAAHTLAPPEAAARLVRRLKPESR